MSEEQKQPEMNRRNFLVRLSLGMAAFSATIVAAPVVSALFAPLIGEDKGRWRKIGRLEDFPVGTTHLVKFKNADTKAYAGVTAFSSAWIRRDSDTTFIAFAANCTHLGCPVRWEEKAHLFMCPCHGGVYYKDGTVAAGPPPKPLTRYPVQLKGQELWMKTEPLPITT